MSEKEVLEMGFKCVGENTFLSKKASFYNPGNIEIGSNVRVDDFVVISAGDGGISIGDYVHVAVHALLIGGGKIQINNFSNISSRVAIYSSSDDYSGESLTNPMVSKDFKNVDVRDVVLGRHSIVGTGSVILPGVVLGEGAAVGALSLVNNDCDEFSIYAGVPAIKIKNRMRDILELEKSFLRAERKNGEK